MKKHIIIAIIAFILGTACGIVGTVLVEKQDVQKEVTIEIATDTDVTETDVIEEVIATETDASSIEIVTTEEVITTEEEVTEEISTTTFYYEPAIAVIATEAPPVEVDGMTYLGTYSPSRSAKSCPGSNFMGFGTKNRTTYFFNCTDGIWVRCGCFFGDIEQFRKQVKKTRTGRIKKEYLMIADLVKMKWKK